jgi:acyl carrier protein
MPEDLTARVIEVIAKTSHKPLETIRPDSTFESIGLDSLDGMQILFALEEEFNVSIPDEAARKIRAIPDAVEGIRALLETRAAGA